MSPDGAQHIAVRQWRDGCSEKLEIHIRYSQRDEWIDVGLMPRKLLHKSRVNEDNPIDARTGKADEEEQTEKEGGKAIEIKKTTPPKSEPGHLIP